MAVNRPSKNSEQPDWFNLELWGRDADFAANYIRKGRLVGIKGSLKFDRWQDRNTGVNRTSPVIKVDRIELLDSKREADSNVSQTYDEF